MLFDLGMRPTDVSQMTELNQTTAYRYFQQWKKTPPFFAAKYRLARKYSRQLSPTDWQTIARVLAHQLGTSEQELSTQMSKPWAMKQIVTGEWRDWPVKRTGGRSKIAQHSSLRSLLSLGWSTEVKHILQMAMNQKNSPLEDEQ